MSSMKKIDHSSSVDGAGGQRGRAQPVRAVHGAGSACPSCSANCHAIVGDRPSGARPALERRAQARGASCACCGARAWNSSPASSAFSIFKLEQWRQKADAALDGALKEREAETASAELAFGHAAHWRAAAWRSSCCAPASSARPFGSAEVALMARGRLPRRRPALRHPARLPDLGRAALQLLRRPGAGAGERCPGLPADAPWTETLRLGRGPARRHQAGPGRPRPGPARDTARSGRACACGTASASPQAAPAPDAPSSALLSPHRARRRTRTAMSGRSSPPRRTSCGRSTPPQVTTVQHGKVWIFGVAERWNAEFLGWRVTKRGTPLRGHPGARHGRPPAVRPSLRRRRPRPRAPPRPRQQLHGRALPEAGQVLGISPSYAFVGGARNERRHSRGCFRTLKEQAIHGRVFQTIDEVRHAIRDFAVRYNAEWLIEKNGYLSPLDARAARLDTNLRRAA